jgi:hypothetical protein
LLDHLHEVTHASVGPGSTPRSRRPWGALAVAAVLLIGGAVAFSLGSGRGPTPLPNVAPSVVPAEPTPGVPTHLVYAPQWTAEVPASAAGLADAVSIVQQRIDATGLFGGQVTTDDQGRIVVEVPVGIDPDPIRRLVGPTGEIGFVPLGDTIVERGTNLDLAVFPPLLRSNEVAGAMVVDDQNGQPTLQILLTGSGGTKFGAFTAAHIGSPFAITLDGTVIASPVINEAIPGGDVQISFPATEADATEIARLATLIRLGPLPVPLVEVQIAPAPGGPTPGASSIAGELLIQCGPRVDVAGVQLECEQAVHSALAFLPVGHPPIKEISFRHGCPEIPGKEIDCATQMFGIVVINFTDASPGVRVLVDYDLKASYLPGSAPPDASAGL